MFEDVDWAAIDRGEKTFKEDYPAQYQLAKKMVLGLGFQMGWKRFWQECRRAGIVEPTKPPPWREAITCFDAGPGRDRMYRMFEALERAGVEITMTAEQTTFRVKDGANLEKVQQIYARHLPKTLKVIQHPSGRNEIVPR